MKKEMILGVMLFLFAVAVISFLILKSNMTGEIILTADEVPLPKEPIAGQYYFHGMMFVINYTFALPVGKVYYLDISLKHIPTGKRFNFNDRIYDDGKHSDGAANDGNYAYNFTLNNSFPLGDYTLIGGITPEGGLSYWGLVGKYYIIERIEGKCKELAAGKNNALERRANLILIPWDADWKTFFYLSNKHLNFDLSERRLNGEIVYKQGEFSGNEYAFFNMQPAKDYRDKFNVWYIDEQYPGSGDFSSFVYSRCPVDGWFIVYSPYVYTGVLGPIYMKTIEFSTKAVLPHELGHAMGGMNDEYPDSYSCSHYTPQGPNPLGLGGPVAPDVFNVYWASDSTNNKKSCEENAPWNYLSGTCFYQNNFYFNCPINIKNISCFHGSNYCREDGYFWAPAENGLMRWMDRETPADISAFCRSFIAETGVKQGICAKICVDGCGKGELCRDSNSDGIGECVAKSGSCTHKDSDGICDSQDNCPLISNTGQRDYDMDGMGDACDSDKDNDGVLTADDCDDFNAKRFPGNLEICDNGMDENCRSDDDNCPPSCIDMDKDGYGKDSLGNICGLGADCNDDISYDLAEWKCPFSSDLCTEITSRCAICINKGAEEYCDNADNDCNNVNDNIARECGSSIGTCISGSESCINGEWSGECTGGVGPVPEVCADGSTNCPICNDGLDNDCDIYVDENCGCKVARAYWSRENVTEGNKVLLMFDSSKECPGFQNYELKIYADNNSYAKFPEFSNYPIGGYVSWEPSFTLGCDSAGVCTSSQLFFTVSPRYHNDSVKSNLLTVLSYCDEDGDLYLKQECIPPILNFNTSVYDCNDLNSSIKPTAVDSCDGFDTNCNGVDDGCLPESCSDGIKNQDESDIDCGGKICGKCENGGSCLVESDCLSGNCLNGICTAVRNAPIAPSGLIVGLNNNKIELSWKDNSNNEEQFVIERKGEDGGWSEVGRVGINIVIWEDRGIALSPDEGIFSVMRDIFSRSNIFK